MDQIESGAMEIILPDRTLPSGNCARRLSVAPRAVPGDPQPYRLSCFGIPGLMNTDILTP
jgi:hypothetical protein